MNEDVVAQPSNTAAKAAWICLGIAWLTFLLPVPGIGVFIGWPLNLVAFVLAIVAMSQRGAMAGLFQLLASLLISPFVYIIGLIILAGSFHSIGDWSHVRDSIEEHGSVSDDARNGDAAEQANIAAIEAMADAASVAAPSSVATPAAASTR